MNENTIRDIITSNLGYIKIQVEEGDSYYFAMFEFLGDAGDMGIEHKYYRRDYSIKFPKNWYFDLSEKESDMLSLINEDQDPIKALCTIDATVIDTINNVKSYPIEIYGNWRDDINTLEGLSRFFEYTISVSIVNAHTHGIADKREYLEMSRKGVTITSFDTE